MDNVSVSTAGVFLRSSSAKDRASAFRTVARRARNRCSLMFAFYRSSPHLRQRHKTNEESPVLLQTLTIVPVFRESCCRRLSLGGWLSTEAIFSDNAHTVRAIGLNLLKRRALRLSTRSRSNEGPRKTGPFRELEVVRFYRFTLL